MFWCIQLSVCQTCVNRDQQIMDPLSSMMMPHSRTQRDLDPFRYFAPFFLVTLIILSYSRTLPIRNTHDFRWGTQQWQDPWQMQPYGFRDPSFQSLLDTQRKQMRAWNPVLDADIVEKVDGSFVLHSDLPGVDPKGENAFPLFLFPFLVYHPIILSSFCLHPRHTSYQISTSPSTAISSLSRLNVPRSNPWNPTPFTAWRGPSARCSAR